MHRKSKSFLLLRIPLHKHKSIRESLREKGIEIPYQDPAQKYQSNEFAATGMYINNYADVRNLFLHTRPNILFEIITDFHSVRLFLYL